MTIGRCYVVLAFTAALTVAAGCTSKDLSPSKQSAAEATPKVRYAYDPLGRLVQAVSAEGNGVQYSYDAVGNVTSIRHLTAGALGIIDFIPKGGMIGSTVTIYGSGFSSTASENAVAFNDTAATVSSATANTLTVSVPASATTGKIAVTTSAGSATSSTDYIVLSSTTGPGIAGFSPAVGNQGTVVSVTGVNFRPSVADDKVLVGGQLAEVVKDASSPTTTLLKFTVPSPTASGKIELTTPFGSVLSSADFIAVPSSVSASDVEASTFVAVGGPAATLTTTTAGKKLVIVFTAMAGQRLHLVATGGSFAAGLSVDVYDPTSTKLQTLSMTSNSVGDFAAPAALGGIYTLVVNPSSTDKGSIQLGVVADAIGALAVDGSTAVSLVSGQNGHFGFTAQANTGYGLALTGVAFTPSTGSPSVTATLRKPDGTTLASCPLGGSGSCDFDPTSFATAGTYFVDVDPAGLVATSFTALLSTDASGTLAIDAPSPTTVTIARPGQNARYTFAGTAGQSMTVVLSGNALDDGDPSTINNTQLLVLPPTSATTAIGSITINKFTTGATLDLQLPSTGTYTLAFRVGGLDSGSIDVQLKSFATGPIALDSSTPVTLSSGQNARLSFTAQANTGYGLAVTDLAFTPSTGAPVVTATLRKSDGTSLASCPFSNNNSCDFDPTSFATTGTYFVDFDPSGIVAASFTAVLSTDASGSVGVDAASPVTVSFARPGQNARYTFAGTAGQSVTVVVNNSTLDDGNAATNNGTQVIVARPSGAAIGNNTFNSFAGGTAIDVALPDTGTYTIIIKPTGLDTGSVNLAVRSVATGALTLDGTTSLTLGAGQNGRFSFTAQAGTGYGLAFANVAFTPSTANPSPGVTATLRKSDGTQLTTCGFSASSSCDLSPVSFAATGTYLLDFDPNGTVAASFDVLLSTDVGGTVAIDAAPATVTFVRAGQNARMTFTGTAGQAVKVVVTGNALDDGNSSTVNTTQLTVFKPTSPAGPSIGNLNFNTVSSGGTLNLTLPDTGTYTIAINPSGLDSGSLNLGVNHQ